MKRLKIIYPDAKKHIGKYYTKPKKLSNPLTQREIEVLRLKRLGLSYGEIALQLDISRQRVSAIYNNIIGRGKVLQS